MSNAALVPEARWLTDRYEFLEELGRGGMGVVYLARDLALDRTVAIKLLGGAHVEDEDAGRRFANEARMVAALDHQNVVRTLAIEELRGGAVAIVNEYVPGRTLRAMLRESGPLPFDRATSLLRDITAGLAHIHRLRIVHRDVKPENIFVEGKSGRALLADFGIARTLDNDMSLTTAGSTFGTPSYMAPEQITGDHVDERADVYALGLIGWEMLAGSRPWEGESLYTLLHNQQHERLPSLAELRPDIPMFLLTAIEGALAKAPELRWHDGTEMLARLTPRPVALPNRHEPTEIVDSAEHATRPIDLPVYADENASVRSAVAPDGDADRYTRRRMSARLAAALFLVAILSGAERPEHVSATTPPAAPDRVNSRSGDVAMHDSRPATPANNMSTAGADSAPIGAIPTPARATNSSATSPAKPGPPPTPRATRATSATLATPKTAAKAAPKGASRATSSRRSATSAAWRCGSDEVEDQRACLLAHIARNDVPMNQTFQALVSQLRREAGGSREPRTVRSLRAEQRAWTAERERTCEARAAATKGSLWGVQRMPCFWQLSREREATLRARLERSRGRQR